MKKEYPRRCRCGTIKEHQFAATCNNCATPQGGKKTYAPDPKPTTPPKTSRRK